LYGFEAERARCSAMYGVDRMQRAENARLVRGLRYLHLQRFNNSLTTAASDFAYGMHCSRRVRVRTEVRMVAGRGKL
jgi:hypothetical protein